MSVPDERYELLRRRLDHIEEASARLLPFVRLTHEDPRAPGDSSRTTYETARHHEFIAEHLEAVEAGQILRLILMVPPRHGKTELCTRNFIPWYMGRHPGESAIMGTYGGEFAAEIGKDVRDVFLHPAYSQVFPDNPLRQDTRSTSALRTTLGNQILFRGRGSALTGSGGHLIVVDDPLKNRQEADSDTIREQLWKWFTQVVMTRLMDDRGRVIVVQTRWHEDDIVGRLTDPHNKHFHATEAKKWKVVNLPAVAEEGDLLKRRPGEALWPSRFDVPYLRSQEALDRRGFSALYQGSPSPDEGAFYSEGDLITYASRKELPGELRWYVASDHAVSTEQDADDTCIIPIGVDKDGIAWVSSEVWWRQADSFTAVNAMIFLMKKFKPLFWWAEKGHISKSIGPFLRRKMLDEGVSCAVLEVQPIGDKMARAQSMHARVSMHMVRFPAFAAWWPAAKRQILQFPYGGNDDFVDTMSLLGLGLGQQVRASTPKKTQDSQPRTGSIAWVKASANAEKRRRQREGARAGW